MQDIVAGPPEREPFSPMVSGGGPGITSHPGLKKVWVPGYTGRLLEVA